MTVSVGSIVRGSPAAIRVSAALKAVAGAIAVAGWLIAFLNVAVSLGVWLSRGSPALPISYAPGPGAIAGLSVCALSYATVGAILAQRLRRNPIGWLLLLVGVIVSAVVPVALVVDDTLSVLRPAPGPIVVGAWLISALTAPAALASAAIAVMLFPDGRAVSASWNRGPRAAVAGAALVVLGTAVGPTQLWYPALPGPAVLRGVPPVVATALQVGGMLLLLIATVVAASALIARFRSADQVLRTQLRWVVMAGMVLLVSVVPLYVVRYAAHVPDHVGERLLILCTFGASVFPLAVGVGMVRHHLFGLDTFLTRTLLRVSLTAILAGLTAATVTLFQRVFIVLSDDTSDVAIIFTTLLLASAFTPVMAALDRFVARAFAGADAGKEREGAAGRDEPDVRSADAVEALQARVAMLEARLGFGIGSGQLPGRQRELDRNRLDRTQAEVADAGQHTVEALREEGR